MRVRAGRMCVVLMCFFMSGGGRFVAHAANGERTLLKRAQPVYPELARRMRVYGQIRLTVSILPNGDVSSVRLESGHPLLVNAAEDAVRQWKYAAAPETTTTSVTVRFDLPE